MNQREQDLATLNRLMYLASWWRSKAYNGEPTRMMVCVRHANMLEARFRKLTRQLFG